MDDSSRDRRPGESAGPTRPGDLSALTALAGTSRDGDPAAREEFLAAARPVMLRWARRLAPDPQTADDVVQDALIEVDRTLHALREPAAVAGWLRLAVRKHADRLHRRRPGPILDLDLALEHARPASAPGGALGGSLGADPAAEAELAEDRAVIRRALAQSGDADRLLLVLRYYGGWREADLAGFLGISGGAVRKRLFDARRRLRGRLATASFAASSTTAAGTDPWENLMTAARTLLGSTCCLDDPLPPDLPPGRPPLTRPQYPDRLATGIKVLDTLVPLPRGGTVDLTGPVGTGHLVLVAEILHNLATAGPAALVAVPYAERAPKGVSARLWKLLEDPAPAADRTVVVTAPHGREAAALDRAATIAAWLAHDGLSVLLAVDEVVADAIAPAGLASATGVCEVGPGSATALRVAPHKVDAEPADPWPGADAEIRLGAAEMVAARLPAVDILGSRTALLDEGSTLPAREREAAHRARSLLAQASELRAYVTQPLRLMEETTGTPGRAIPVDDAVTGLSDLLAGPPSTR